MLNFIFSSAIVICLSSLLSNSVIGVEASTEIKYPHTSVGEYFSTTYDTVGDKNVVTVVALNKNNPLSEINTESFCDHSRVVISDSDYADPEGKFVKSLQDNIHVVDLTIHVGFDVWDNVCYQNYKDLILKGLQNKPNLRRLTIVGNFDTDIFCQSEGISMGNRDMDPEELLKYDHLKFFKNLQELHVTKYIMGNAINNYYMYLCFFPHLIKTYTLKQYTYTWL